MVMNYPAGKLSEVFRNIGGHFESSEIILAHSTNKEDVRDFALRNVNISHALQIIDLGCGFGFFTQKLKGKISNQAVVTGIDCFAEYRSPYIGLCTQSGFNGQFYDTGTAALDQFKPSSVHLIVSSFSIYFFPDVMAEVAEKLKETGTFIVITHFSSHLKEFTDMINETLKEMGYLVKEQLPHDKLIKNFPAEEGIERLSGHFRKIEKREYINELRFSSEASVDQLMKYILYKRSFFVPEDISEDPSLFMRVESKLREKITTMNEIRITKNDGVFICTHPLKNKM
jgi:ubiquinone/menaquinone biosynthesis C-methylase UbiE